MKKLSSAEVLIKVASWGSKILINKYIHHYTLCYTSKACYQSQGRTLKTHRLIEVVHKPYRLVKFIPSSKAVQRFPRRVQRLFFKKVRF